MRKRHRIVSSVFLLFVLLTGGAACTKSSSSLTVNPISYVSLINEATYSGTANLYLNDTLVTVQQGISAGTFSTRYGTIRPGTYSVKFVNANTDSLMGSIPGVPFDTLNFYTLVVCNVPNGGSAAQAFQVWDNFSTISTTNSNYRFFNLCSDFPSVDVYLNNSLVQSGRTTADNAGNQTLNSFQSVSPGNYTVTVKMAGTDSVVATVNTGLFQGDAYTIFLGGNVKSHLTPVQVNILQASY